MKRFICCLLAVAFVALASAHENPLKKSSTGDWAKYLVTSKNETVPLLSTKDKPRWRVISNIGDDWVRCDNYLLFGGQRSSGLGVLYNFKDRFEPVPGVSQTAKVKVTSTTKEEVTINGKQYECTKVVRKIDQPVDDEKMEASWIGTSTLWLCDQIPLGLAKMENVYQTQLIKDADVNKITETWIVADSGFKDFNEEMVK
jgi:hypothetical protein